jgi:uncharacterized coiled-coil DUF342 family protein
MASDVINPDAAEELKNLQAEFEAASKEAREIDRRIGIVSPEFQKADRAAAALWRRIKRLKEEAGSH